MGQWPWAPSPAGNVDPGRRESSRSWAWVPSSELCLLQEHWSQKTAGKGGKLHWEKGGVGWVTPWKCQSEWDWEWAGEQRFKSRGFTAASTKGFCRHWMGEKICLERGKNFLKKGEKCTWKGGKNLSEKREKSAWKEEKNVFEKGKHLPEKGEQFCQEMGKNCLEMGKNLLGKGEKSSSKGCKWGFKWIILSLKTTCLIFKPLFKSLKNEDCFSLKDGWGQVEHPKYPRAAGIESCWTEATQNRFKYTKKRRNRN